MHITSFPCFPVPFSFILKFYRKPVQDKCARAAQMFCEAVQGDTKQAFLLRKRQKENKNFLANVWRT
ncbi:hypothetical protein ACH33_05260 [Aneurinibacillus sp. XH2]|nr:hypothetical protein ACH33_05260 [Aneurinibacillus sp. XH2]